MPRQTFFCEVCKYKLRDCLCQLPPRWRTKIMFLEAELESFRLIRKELKTARHETKRLTQHNEHLRSKIAKKSEAQIAAKHTSAKITAPTDPHEAAARSINRILRRWYPQDYETK